MNSILTHIIKYIFISFILRLFIDCHLMSTKCFCFFPHTNLLGKFSFTTDRWQGGFPKGVGGGSAVINGNFGRSRITCKK